MRAAVDAVLWFVGFLTILVVCALLFGLLAEWCIRRDGGRWL